MFEPHVSPPTDVGGTPSILREAVVVTINANGTVDLKATDSRTGWTQMTVPGWYTPVVGDHVVVGDLQGDPQNARVVSVFSGTPFATATAAQGMTGEVRLWAGSSAPAGWQMCNGADAATTALDTFLKAQTPASPYGLNGGTSKAKVPNLSGRGPLAPGTATGAPGATAHTLGQVGGEETHALTVAELAAHGHPLSVTIFQTPNGLGGIAGASGGGTAVDHGSTADSVGSGTAHNNLPPYVGLNFIIKT